jgi:hypothetical protein
LTNRRNSRRWWFLAGVVAVAVLAYCNLPFTPLPAHSGDGDFTDLSWRPRALGVLPVYNVQGFAVSMPRFGLGEDHTSEYRFGRLPDIGCQCELYLAIDDPGGRWLMRDDDIRKLQGSLSLKVMDAGGEIICHEEGPLRDYIWGYWRGANRLYQEDALWFRTRPGEEYTLRVEYHADPALANFQGYCYLQAGGRK